MADHLVPPSFAAKYVQVTKQTLNYWRASGRLEVKAYSLVNRGPLVSLDDVLRVERDMRLSPQSHRRTLAA